MFAVEAESRAKIAFSEELVSVWASDSALDLEGAVGDVDGNGFGVGVGVGVAGCRTASASVSPGNAPMSVTAPVEVLIVTRLHISNSEFERARHARSPLACLPNGEARCRR